MGSTINSVPLISPLCIKLNAATGVEGLTCPGPSIDARLVVNGATSIGTVGGMGGIAEVCTPIGTLPIILEVCACVFA